MGVGSGGLRTKFGQLCTEINGTEVLGLFWSRHSVVPTRGRVERPGKFQTWSDFETGDRLRAPVVVPKDEPAFLIGSPDRGGGRAQRKRAQIERDLVNCLS